MTRNLTEAQQKNGIKTSAMRMAQVLSVHISGLISIILTIFAFGFISWTSYFRVNDGVVALSEQLTHLITVGDRFQIRSQLLSLASSGIIDYFYIEEPSGIVLAENSVPDVQAWRTFLSKKRNTSFFVNGASWFLLLKFELPAYEGQFSKLIVAKRLHFEIFILGIFLQLFLFFSIHRIIRGLVSRFAGNLTDPIQQLAEVIGTSPNYETLSSDSNLYDGLKFSELQETLESFIGLLNRLKCEEDLRIIIEKESVFSKLALQVSHDIRSPLAALKMILSSVDELPEEKRLIIRNAVNRIGDIANSLLSKGRAQQCIQETFPSINLEHAVNMDLKILESQYLFPLIDSVISEKRLQYRDQLNIVIEFNHTTCSYGLFSKIALTEFKRVISNIINNSVEAMEKEVGKITISLRNEKAGQIEIIFSDNGKGIPKEILPKLAKKGATFGKHDGNGLGLYHARKMLANIGGALRIESQTKPSVTRGTTITILLPRMQAPDWFVSKLKLKNDTKIIIFDDDQTIHQIWDERFKSSASKEQPLEINHISSPHALRKYFGQNFADLEDALFLMDYEILNHQETGLDLIEELGIRSQSILVTNRYEESSIRARCQSLGVKLIPKSMSGFVPIEIV